MENEKYLVKTKDNSPLLVEASTLMEIHNLYPEISFFNKKGELTFNHKFKLVFGKRKGRITYIYTTNLHIISNFKEFEYTSEDGKEGKATYTKELLLRLINCVDC